MTRDIVNDAGLLREYIGEHFDIYFGYGISGERFGQMLRLVNRLARLTGRSQQEVMADLVDDASNREWETN